MCLFSCADGPTSSQLDILSDEIMIDTLVKSGTCALLVSEEQEEPIIVPPELRGSLCCAFDPLVPPYELGVGPT